MVMIQILLISTEAIIVVFARRKSRGKRSWSACRVLVVVSSLLPQLIVIIIFVRLIIVLARQSFRIPSPIFTVFSWMSLSLLVLLLLRRS